MCGATQDTAAVSNSGGAAHAHGSHTAARWQPVGRSDHAAQRAAVAPPRVTAQRTCVPSVMFLSRYAASCVLTCRSSYSFRTNRSTMDVLPTRPAATHQCNQTGRCGKSGVGRGCVQLRDVAIVCAASWQAGCGGMCAASHVAPRAARMPQHCNAGGSHAPSPSNTTFSLWRPAILPQPQRRRASRGALLLTGARTPTASPFPHTHTAEAPC